MCTINNHFFGTFDLQKIQNRDDTDGKISLELQYTNGSYWLPYMDFCDSSDPLTYDIEGFNKSYQKFCCTPSFSDNT